MDSGRQKAGGGLSLGRGKTEGRRMGWSEGVRDQEVCARKKDDQGSSQNRSATACV